MDRKLCKGLGDGLVSDDRQETLFAYLFHAVTTLPL